MSRMSEEPKKEHAEWYGVSIYPIISFLLILAIVNYLLLFVMPQFEVIFAPFEKLELPLVTKILMNPLCRVLFPIGSFAFIILGAFLIRKTKKPKLFEYAMIGIVAIIGVLAILAFLIPLKLIAK
jgi:type II secretory pathway component PulF